MLEVRATNLSTNPSIQKSNCKKNSSTIVVALATIVALGALACYLQVSNNLFTLYPLKMGIPFGITSAAVCALSIFLTYKCVPTRITDKDPCKENPSEEQATSTAPHIQNDNSDSSATCNRATTTSIAEPLPNPQTSSALASITSSAPSPTNHTVSTIPSTKEKKFPQRHAPKPPSAEQHKTPDKAPHVQKPALKSFPTQQLQVPQAVPVPVPAPIRLPKLSEEQKVPEKSDWYNQSYYVEYENFRKNPMSWKGSTRKMFTEGPLQHYVGTVLKELGCDLNYNYKKWTDPTFRFLEDDNSLEVACQFLGIPMLEEKSAENLKKIADCMMGVRKILTFFQCQKPLVDMGEDFIKEKINIERFSTTANDPQVLGPLTSNLERREEVLFHWVKDFCSDLQSFIQKEYNANRRIELTNYPIKMPAYLDWPAYSSLLRPTTKPIEKEK